MYSETDQPGTVVRAPLGELVHVLEDGDADVSFPARGSQGNPEQGMQGYTPGDRDYSDPELIDDPVDRTCRRYGIDKV